MYPIRVRGVRNDALGSISMHVTYARKDPTRTDPATIGDAIIWFVHALVIGVCACKISYCFSTRTRCCFVNCVHPTSSSSLGARCTRMHIFRLSAGSGTNLRAESRMIFTRLPSPVRVDGVTPRTYASRPTSFGLERAKPNLWRI